MRKKIMGIIAAVAIAAVVGYNTFVSQNNMQLSALVLANVEALARYEYPDMGITCNQSKYTTPGYCWIGKGECFQWTQRWTDCEFTGYMSHTCNTPCP